MIALLKIQCPHCGSAGQILMPPPGAIIIGPCPECSKLVAIFAGEALPLDDDIMNNGAMKDKYEHVMQILSAYLEEQVRQCFTQAQDVPAVDDDGREGRRERPDKGKERPERLITDDEFDHFIQKELGNLDDPEFFERLG